MSASAKQTFKSSLPYVIIPLSWLLLRSVAILRRDCDSLRGRFGSGNNGYLWFRRPFFPLCHILRTVLSPTNNLIHSDSNPYKQSSPIGKTSCFKVTWMTRVNRGKHLPTVAIIHQIQSTIPPTIQGYLTRFTNRIRLLTVFKDRTTLSRCCTASCSSWGIQLPYTCITFNARSCTTPTTNST